MSWHHVLVPVDDGATTGPQPPRLLVWQEELNTSAGYRALGLMAYVRRIGYVFQANVSQYNALVGRIQDPAFSLPIFDMANPQAHDDLLSEIERLLHNVLMALSTRIDQQRAFIKRHFADDAALIAEYAATVESYFGKYAAGMFLRDLRNYLTHYQLPVAQSEQTFSQQSFSVTFVLVRQTLLDWSGWKSDTKKWLRAQSADIRIVEVVNGYARIAGTFDNWLHERIGVKYAVDIREYEAAAESFNQEWERTFDI